MCSPKKDNRKVRQLRKIIFGLTRGYVANIWSFLANYVYFLTTGPTTDLFFSEFKMCKGMLFFNVVLPTERREWLSFGPVIIIHL